MDANTRFLWRQGLWDRNPGVVQLLGLCPLLAVTGTAVNGLGLGLATIFVLVLSNLIVSLLRGWIAPQVRIPAFVLIIASLVTAVDLIMQAWFFTLSTTLGIFVPLIVTNCTILGRAEAYASRNPVSRAITDGLAQGLGFALVLVMLGSIREIIGHGTLMADAHLLLGGWARILEMQLLPGDAGLLLAVLPPGAFLALGLLVAAHRRLSASRPEAIAETAREPQTA